MEKAATEKKRETWKKMKEMPLRWCPEPEMRCKKFNCAGGKREKRVETNDRW